MNDFFKNEIIFIINIFILAIALIMFRNDKDITHTIIGAIVGFITVPKKQ
jgi:hypothetical protein